MLYPLSYRGNRDSIAGAGTAHVERCPSGGVVTVTPGAAATGR
jgi:hypothetical protein